MKPRILLLYPYYWPHYKAGGPVQSMFNMVSVLKQHADFYLVSRDRDLGDSKRSDQVETDKWARGPSNEYIYYVSRLSPMTIFRLVREVRPNVIFINGLFNVETTLFGLLSGLWAGCAIIISPRGMLQKWGLDRNRIVKKAYLSFLKLFMNRKIQWHATTATEKEEIIKNFGHHSIVHVASNVPRQVASSDPRKPFSFDKNHTRLVFLSLINPNKNLHVVIDEVRRREGVFQLDIYGPVIDAGYWADCIVRMGDSDRIVYKGAVPPWETPAILSSYDFFVLPTQGENFGHAIFDSLACGTPVIISKSTPWNGLEKFGAGFYMDVARYESLGEVFDKLSSLSPAHYQEYRANSLRYASEFWNQADFITNYKFLIDPQSEL
jgi:glycosyltransferase involved in cell wall biosynthesis